MIAVAATNRAFAQEPTTTSLIVSSYSSKADLDFLFKNSTVVLKYLEGTEIDKTIFLALATSVQKLLIEKRGLPVTVIDETPDISRYKLYFTYESNKSDLLRPFGAIFPITPHHTLIRFPGGTNTEDPLHDAQARFDVEFFDSPFMGALPTPKFQTATITLAPTVIPAQSSTDVTPANQNPSPSRSSLPLILLIVVGIIGIIGIIILLKKKLAKEDPETSSG